MSKEMYAYRPKRGVLAEYMALMLRTEVAKTLIHGWITGTSNRTRLADAEQLLAIPVPKPPSAHVQKQMVKDLKNAAKNRDNAAASAESAARAAASIWKINVTSIGLDEEEADDEVSPSRKVLPTSRSEHASA